MIRRHSETWAEWYVGTVVCGHNETWAHGLIGLTPIKNKQKKKHKPQRGQILS